MAVPEGVETLAGRLATFEGPQQTSKRRTSTKKKTPATVSWPHRSPSPEELAKAGFFYKPSATNEDNVTCFLCQKSLDGWDANDNPALEHLGHVPDCGWAINVCIEQRMQDEDRAEEDPLNERMMEARRATFRNAWPHESKKAWKCKTQKMVEAGWCYNPVPEADDCVQCFYCGVSLDGWEPKDDPWTEHQKRAPECHFFTLVDESKKLQNATKGKRGRASRTSKQSRLSTQSNLTVNSEPPSFTSMENTLADEDDTMMSTATASSKTGRGRKAPPRKKAAAKPKRTSTKTKTTTPDAAALPDLKDEMDIEQGLEADTTTLSVAEKKPKSKRQAKHTTSEAPVSLPAVELDEPTNKPLPQKKTRQRAAKKQTTPVDDEAERQLGIPTEDDEEEQGAAPKAKRGRKRTSDGQEKLDDSVVFIEQPEMEQLTTKDAKSKATRNKKNKASDQPMQQAAQGYLAAGSPKATKANDNVDSSPVVSQHELVPVTLGETIEPPARKQRVVPSQPQKDLAKAKKASTTAARDTAADPKKDKKNRILSPPASPQSSDAENQAPSSRPSFNAALDEAETGASYDKVSTPTKSPAKHTLIAGGLQSAFPWNAVDLETALLLSPNSRTEGMGVDEVLQRMASPEKRMTIEEWIQWNAQRAEERLKQDCERLVSVFESEGVKALRAVEGIECV